ncbi:MAG: cytochrome c oxidase accessory protein CcoG [Myroides sp.]|jgi:cytochrome c oxidase accessory protein FixG|nr:cytochrome c oxidase accessory protein CcoG [Myroides sp.]
MKTPDQENFRDSINTIDEQGKRKWIYPKKVSGKFMKYRKLVAYALLTFLFIAPFIKVNGNQFLLFNVLDRRFSIFGQPFWPQDFYIFVLCMIVGIVFVALFTVAFGRIFCGWICPQTIFLEMVFRQIEFWIEGDRGAQIRLDKQPWNSEKIRKKGLKWSVFALISFIIANIFLAYLISSDTLIKYITEGPTKHSSTLIALLIFTAVFYFIFAWFREQVCIIACPYGRLQGVLLDNKSIIVAYDYKRGEKENGRAKFNKKENRSESGKGDCIDCEQCVQVCPTGIDIRNGTQLECVGCTACIDICNTMMVNVGMPTGLIRYTSEEEIVQKKRFEFTPRLKAYSAVLFILIGILTGILFLRTEIQTNIVRLPGQLFEHTENGLKNVYTFKILNKKNEDITNLTIKVIDIDADLQVVGKPNLIVPKGELIEGTLFIEIATKDILQENTSLKIGIYQDGELIETTKTNFLGPKKLF